MQSHPLPGPQQQFYLVIKGIIIIIIIIEQIGPVNTRQINSSTRSLVTGTYFHSHNYQIPDGSKDYLYERLLKYVTLLFEREKC